MDTVPADVGIAPVAVKIVNADEITRPPVQKPKGVKTTFRTFVITATTNAIQILAYAPSRRRACITVIGQAATDTVYLCGSQGDAAPAASSIVPAGAIALAGMTFWLEGTDAVYAAIPSGVTQVLLGVIQEFDIEV